MTGTIPHGQEQPTAVAQRRGRSPSVKIAYTMSRFPKLTETFILYEILALEARGVQVELYPLIRERQPVVHPDALRLVGQAHYLPFMSLPILWAQLHYLVRQPWDYFRVLFEVLTGTFRSPNFFVGALGIFAKTVKFAYEMEKAGVTHLHAHFCNHPAVAALIVHRLTGIPYSFTAHGSDLHKDRRMLDRKVANADFVVTVSRYNKELIVRECGEQVRDKIHIIHCGVDPEVFPGEPRIRPGRRFNILCIASFEEVKGHKYLVEACKLLAQEGIDFECHLIGEGPLRSAIERLIVRSGLRNQVLVHGGQPREKVIEFLTNADVKVLASVPTRSGKREGIPVALMEAMASCLPVVSSALSGIPELVEDGLSGFLCEPGDATAIASALKKLHDDAELRYAMGRSGREKILKEFNLKKNVVELANLFVAQHAVPPEFETMREDIACHE